MGTILWALRKIIPSILMGKRPCRKFLNNRCDILATEAADGNHLFIDEGYEQEE